MQEIGIFEGGMQLDPNHYLIRKTPFEHGFEILVIGNNQVEVIKVANAAKLQTYDMVDFDPGSPPDLVPIEPLPNPTYWQIESDSVQALLDDLQANRTTPADEVLRRSSASPLNPELEPDALEFGIGNSAGAGGELEQQPGSLADRSSLGIMIRRVDAASDWIGVVVATFEADLPESEPQVDDADELEAPLASVAALDVDFTVIFDKNGLHNPNRHRYFVNDCKRVIASYYAEPGPLQLNLSPHLFEWNDALGRFESPVLPSPIDWTLIVRKTFRQETHYTLTINGDLQSRVINPHNL